MVLKKASLISFIVIFLALIRCILEPLRLLYYSGKILTVSDMKPFMLGSFVCALALLIMTLLVYSSRYKFVILIAGLAIVGLLILKVVFSIPWYGTPIWITWPPSV